MHYEITYRGTKYSYHDVNAAMAQAEKLAASGPRDVEVWKIESAYVAKSHREGSA